MHTDKRKQLTGRGGVDTAAVAGVRDRATGRVTAQPVADIDAVTLVPYVTRWTWRPVAGASNVPKDRGGLMRRDNYPPG